MRTPHRRHPPRRNFDTSSTPQRLAEVAEQVVYEGSREHSSYWEDNFPKYAWVRREGAVYEARLINRGRGNYKGYPLNDDEIPKELP